MKKIAVFGKPGRGKSTLSKNLSSIFTLFLLEIIVKNIPIPFILNKFHPQVLPRIDLLPQTFIHPKLFSLFCSQRLKYIF